MRKNNITILVIAFLSQIVSSKLYAEQYTDCFTWRSHIDTRWISLQEEKNLNLARLEQIMKLEQEIANLKASAEFGKENLEQSFQITQLQEERRSLKPKRTLNEQDRLKADSVEIEEQFALYQEQCGDDKPLPIPEENLESK